MTDMLKKQAVWFLIVGAAAALTHFLALVALVNWGGVAPAWGNVGAFLIAFVVSFTGHFSLTFDEQTERQRWLLSLAKWFASSLAGFLANQSLFVLGLHYVGNRYYIPIWFVVTVLVTVMTFALGKWWAFRH